MNICRKVRGLFQATQLVPAGGECGGAGLGDMGCAAV